MTSHTPVTPIPFEPLAVPGYARHFAVRRCGRRMVMTDRSVGLLGVTFVVVTLNALIFAKE